MNYAMNRFFTSLIIGINSGLVYALLTSTFSAYLTDQKVSITMIGLLSLRTIPYSFKYLWSPVIDSVIPKFFPKNFTLRKRWMIIAQVLLIIFICILGLIDTERHFYAMCFVTIMVSILGASYDIAMQAYRIELFKPKEQSKGNFFNIAGFRIGLIISGVLGLYMSSFLPWGLVFCIMAGCIIPCIYVVWHSHDTKREDEEFAFRGFKIWFREDFMQPFYVLSKLPNLYLILLMISFYKVSDAYLDAMFLPFLMDIGCSKVEIAAIVKTVGMIATIAGVGAGSYMSKKFDILQSLFMGELLAAVSNVLFIFLNNSQSKSLLTSLVCIESFASGICSVLIINYMSSLCDNKRFTATHFAIFVSVSGIAKTVISSTSGWMVWQVGWSYFFIFSSILSVPSLLCIYYLHKINAKSHP